MLTHSVSVSDSEFLAEAVKASGRPVQFKVLFLLPGAFGEKWFLNAEALIALYWGPAREVLGVPGLATEQRSPPELCGLPRKLGARDVLSWVTPPSPLLLPLLPRCPIPSPSSHSTM